MFNSGADGKEPIREAAVQVVKIGGSVLKSRQDYLRSAEFLQGRLASRQSSKLVVVVSARWGETDELLQAARQISPDPDRRTLDLLWSCGELRSVALLAFCLQRLGIPALGLNVHETGLRLRRQKTDGGTSASLPNRTSGLRQRLACHAALIVPGFFAIAADHSLTSLGRGGSDLTALLIAHALKAAHCELVKDVAGYFDRDPNRFEDARPLAVLSYRRALEMARSGCDLVQKQALECACRLGIPLLVRSMQSSLPGTWVGEATGLQSSDSGLCKAPDAWHLPTHP